MHEEYCVYRSVLLLLASCVKLEGKSRVVVLLKCVVYTFVRCGWGTVKERRQ